jgi:Arc/MetJ family transcription regulator
MSRIIELDDDLAQKVMEDTGVPTPPEAVDEALRIFMQRGSEDSVAR